MCASSEGSGQTECMRRRASEHRMIKYSISVKSLMSHTKQPFSFENSGCSLISNHASAQSNLGYCDLHTQHMNMIVCVH